MNQIIVRNLTYQFSLELNKQYKGSVLPDELNKGKFKIVVILPNNQTMSTIQKHLVSLTANFPSSIGIQFLITKELKGYMYLKSYNYNDLFDAMNFLTDLSNMKASMLLKTKETPPIFHCKLTFDLPKNIRRDYAEHGYAKKAIQPRK